MLEAHGKKGTELRKVADLTVDEFKSLLFKIQSEAIAAALEKAFPVKDPDEYIYKTTQQAADFLNVTRQTIQAKKKAKLLESEGEGRLTRFTVAALKRYMKIYGTPTSALKKAQKRAEKGKASLR
jgi:excisionase family DNA binding protein